MAEQLQPTRTPSGPTLADTARTWADQSCAAQDLPVKVSAQAVVAAIAAQLTAGRPTP